MHSLVLNRIIISSIGFLIYRLCFSEQGKEDLILGALPMFHVYGGFNALGSLSMGSQLICLPKFSFSGMMEVIEEYRVGYFCFISSTVMRLLSKHM